MERPRVVYPMTFEEALQAMLVELERKRLESIDQLNAMFDTVRDQMLAQAAAFRERDELDATEH